MIRRSFARWLVPLALAFVMLGLTPVARAQEEVTPGGEKSEGRPFDGYFAVGVLAGAALFAVGKTARR